ncbi:DNA-directed DNA polymerase [Tanacetum coccineum]
MIIEYGVYNLLSNTSNSIRTSSISLYLSRKKVNDGGDVIQYKFIDEGKRKHEEMRAFICDFQTTNEILFKERNNSLIELRFGVQELLKVINNTPMIDCEVKGVTTRGGKTTTQDAQNNDDIVHTEEPHTINQDKLVESVEEKEEAQQKKFLENLKQLHINLPFIEILTQMPKYAKFLKGLLTNKARLEEACTITMNERCSTVLLNKLPSKEKDPGSFTIPCDIGQLHINNALADLGASISLMPYTMYENLRLGEPKATRMSLELADRSIQYPRRIIENVLIKVDKFILLIDFVILDMPEDSRVTIILGRPFLATAQAMIDVFNKKITLKVRDDEVIFDVDQSIKRPPIEDDECYEIDDLDDTINSDLEGCKPECKTNNDSRSEEPIRRIASISTSYPVVQEITKPIEVEREHLYSASANEIDEKKPELKDLPNHLEYAYLIARFFQIPIAPEESRKDNIHLSLWDFCLPKNAFWVMQRFSYFFQRCMIAIFHDMVEDFMEVFKDDFSVFGNSFDCCLANLDRMLARCEEANLVLNWEKCHFMVNEGTVLGHKISGQVLLLQGFGIEIKDKRGAENLAADHLSRLENPDLGMFTEEETADEFPDEHLMVLKTELNNNKPWGHHSASVTGRKVYESGFFLPTIFKDAKDYMMRCDACQRSRNISSRSEMPQNNIQIWCIREHPDLQGRTKKWHDSRLRGDKDFKVEDLVLLFNSRFKMHPGKLKSRWYGPNVVKTVYPYGTVEITDKNRVSFKVNGQRLKKYHERHIDTEDKEVVEFEEDTT